MKTKLLKICRSIVAKAPATSRNGVNPLSGSYTHTLWYDSGVRGSNPWAPKLMVGVRYSAPREKMPEDGGDYPAGKYTTTIKTGKWKILFD